MKIGLTIIALLTALIIIALGGIAYQQGHVVPQNYAQVQIIEQIKQQAEQGDPLAQLKLGALYAFGHGIPQDFEQTIHWWTKAAEQGETRAQYELGIAYDNGYGVDQDRAQAFYWFTQAAEQGLRDAQFELGIAYDLGHGIPENDAQATHWYHEAAMQGHHWSQRNLASDLGKLSSIEGCAWALIYNVNAGPKERIEERDHCGGYRGGYNGSAPIQHAQQRASELYEEIQANTASHDALFYEDLEDFEAYIATNQP